MNRLTSLWCSLAQELGDQLSVHVSHDLNTVVSRIGSEGLSFLTITLPTYCASFEASLASGQIAPTAFAGFRKAGRAPAFLKGFLGLVFDTKSGDLLTCPDTDAIFAVRQLTLFYKKMELACTDKRNQRAFQAYVQCDKEVRNYANVYNLPHGKAALKRLQRVFSALFWPVLRDVSSTIEGYGLEPKHGPGATADAISGNHKWYMKSWPQRFEDNHLFPYREYVMPRYGLDYVPELTVPSGELPVRVITVPKTLSSPRVIAMEPSCMMYMQQGIKDALVPRLERDRMVGPMIGFTDQEPNRLMAKAGSVDGSLATLDLSEASDRVSVRVVRELVSQLSPVFWEAIDTTRSRNADVQGKVVRLAKFASMGSALCFPVESMVFLAVVFYGIESALGHRLSREDIMSFHGKVRVYGDDIVVPVSFAPFVTAALETFGLKVNKGKSFSDGLFRESCGGDYYAGVFVTPVRGRNLLPRSRRDVDLIVTWASTMNQLYERGLWQTAKAVQGFLEGILGRLPIVPVGSQAVGLHSFQGSEYQAERTCPLLHVPQVKAWVVKHRIPQISVEGYAALRKCFAGNYEDPSYAGHLETSGRPSDAKLIRRWVSAEERVSLL